MKNTFLYILFVIISLSGFAQNNDIELAQQYVDKGDYEKASELYSDLFKDKTIHSLIYEQYRATLIKLKEFSTLEKVVNKLLKEDPENYLYQVDNTLLLLAEGNKEEYDKEINKIINNTAKLAFEVEKLHKIFEKRNLTDESIKLFDKARFYHGNHKYCSELANLYAKKGQKELMINELINYALYNYEMIEYVENTLQNRLPTDSEFDKLADILFDRLATHKEELVYYELLGWYYIQKGDFFNAFVQYRAIDKRKQLKGEKLMELAEVAVSNVDYSTAINIYNHVSAAYPEEYISLKAKKLEIETKELKVKNTYPVSTEEVRMLISDFNGLYEIIGRLDDKAEIKRSIALLYAFYLNDVDKAVEILEEINKTPRLSLNIQNECKLDLADIYVLKGEYWRSTLLYLQVEKDNNNSELGHLAKLKNAKLSYYQSDFLLADENLDILKDATSRKIANDAMKLHILIQDNLALDTTHLALKAYAEAELLIYQNQFEPAIKKLDSLKMELKNHPLDDELMFLQATVYKNMNNYTAAIERYNKVAHDYQYDILVDDALFEMATIYDKHLKDKAKAQEYYKEILVKYPGSIFAAESRKRYRTLRGDKI